MRVKECSSLTSITLSLQPVILWIWQLPPNLLIIIIIIIFIKILSFFNPLSLILGKDEFWFNIQRLPVDQRVFLHLDLSLRISILSTHSDWFSLVAKSLLRLLPFGMLYNWLMLVMRNHWLCLKHTALSACNRISVTMLIILLTHFRGWILTLSFANVIQVPLTFVISLQLKNLFRVRAWMCDSKIHFIPLLKQVGLLFLMWIIQKGRLRSLVLVITNYRVAVVVLLFFELNIILIDWVHKVVSSWLERGGTFLSPSWWLKGCLLLSHRMDRSFGQGLLLAAHWYEI